MTEYYYPNEVEIKVINGKRRAFLKPNWKEIRKENTASIVGEPRDEELATQMLKDGMLYLNHRSVNWNRMQYENKIIDEWMRQTYDRILLS